MQKNHLLLAALAVVLLAPAALWAQKADEGPRGPFIHIEVREAEGEEGAVDINLPLALAQAALEAGQESLDKHSHLTLDDSDLSVSDLRRMWKAMSDAGDTEFVTVREQDETVRIYREGEKVFVKVDASEGKEKVRISVPVRLMDALLGGEGEELDLRAALAELGRMEKGEIVSVEDEGETVRIWID